MAAVTEPLLRIILVEDDDVFRERLARALRERGHAVLPASDGAAARAAGALGFDAAIVDVGLGTDSGLDVAAELLRVHPKARVVMMTGAVSDGVTVESLRLGAVGCLRKPFDADDALDLLKGQRQ